MTQSTQSRGWRDCLDDILDSSLQIRAYVEDLTFGEFVENRLVFDAVVRNFIVIGEAARLVPDDVRARLPRIDWRRLNAFRNVLVHEYFQLDASVIWRTCNENLIDLISSARDAMGADADADAWPGPR